MKIILFTLLLLLLTTLASAAEVTLALNPNSTVDPTGYRLLWGQESGKYTGDIDLGSKPRDVKFTVPIDLESGKTYYFVATAYDGQGNESSYSKEVSRFVPIIPPTIEGIEITVNITLTVTN